MSAAATYAAIYYTYNRFWTMHAATEAFAILLMILAGPLCLAILLLGCVGFGRQRKSVLIKIMILSFFVAVLVLCLLVRK